MFASKVHRSNPHDPGRTRCNRLIGDRISVVDDIARVDCKFCLGVSEAGRHSGNKGNRSAYKHGMTGTPTYMAWQSMRSNHRHDGMLDSRWFDFSAFFHDMGERPANGHLRRLDPTKPFSKSNCEWRSLPRSTGNLLRDVQIWLRETGTPASLLGRAALGDPTFYKRLRAGTEPRLETEARVREFMRRHPGKHYRGRVKIVTTIIFEDAP